MPLVVERAHCRIVDERSRRVLARLGIDATQLAGTEAELLARVRPAATSDIPAKLLAPFVAAHDAVANTTTSPAAKQALAKTRASVERSVNKLASKLERIAAYEDVELVDAVRRARAWLAPDGELQERRLGVSCFAARIGDRAVVERVLAAITPFDPAMKELS
jgi:hypothetical protein